jgi:hypothetical protein
MDNTQWDDATLMEGDQARCPSRDRAMSNSSSTDGFVYVIMVSVKVECLVNLLLPTVELKNDSSACLSGSII